MREVEVRIPGRPPGANALHRQGFWKVRKERGEWLAVSHGASVVAMTASPYARDWIVTAVGRSGRSPASSSYVEPGRWWPLSRASLAVEWRCKTRRRRDYDNLVAGLKPLIDGLVSAGIIEDDDSEHLVSLGPLTVTPRAAADETVLTVREES